MLRNLDRGVNELFPLESSQIAHGVLGSGIKKSFAGFLPQRKERRMIRREKDGERNSAGEKKRKREKDGEKPTFPRDVIQIRASEILELPFPKPSWLKIEKEGVHPRRSVDNTELFTSLTSFEDSRVFSHIWTDNCWFLWYSMGCFFANLAQSLPPFQRGWVSSFSTRKSRFSMLFLSFLGSHDSLTTRSSHCHL